MGFWNQTKRIVRFKAAENRVQEASLYGQVMDELESGNRDNGLWGKALAESDGDEKKATAEYMKLRVVALTDLLNVHEDAQAIMIENVTDSQVRAETSRRRRKGCLIAFVVYLVLAVLGFFLENLKG